MGPYGDDDLLALSGVQHYAFCPRQWGLIAIGQLWAENAFTAQGSILHDRAHNEAARERRGDTLVVRGLGVVSHELGLFGVCDVVEFRLDDRGVPLSGEEGLWTPVPIEYKRGHPKEGDEDRIQLCAQAMCLEEMLACDIDTGFMFYGQTRRREKVFFSADLRRKVAEVSAEMHSMARRGHVPRVRKRRACGSCSLADLCIPKVTRSVVSDYIDRALGDADQ